jgi:hypothetical protein
MRHRYSLDLDRQWRAERKQRVFAHYGETCSCCGTAGDLTIELGDTVEPDRRRHGAPLYGFLIREGFPPASVLCRRCATSKRRGTVCRLDHPSSAGPD